MDRYGCCGDGGPDWFEKRVVKETRKERCKCTAMGRGKGTRRRRGRSNQTNSSDPASSRHNVVKIQRELEALDLAIEQRSITEAQRQREEFLRTSLSNTSHLRISSERSHE